MAYADILLRGGAFTLEYKEGVPNNFLIECKGKKYMHIFDEDIRAATEYLKVLMYLAGYCCHSLIKKLKCLECRKYLTVKKAF